MKITEIKNAIKVFDIETRWDNSKSIIKISNKIKNTSLLKSNAGRVYLIVIDGQVMKIGGSESKGGILSTFGFYCGAMSGGPSDRTFGCMYLMRKALDEGKKVEIYLIKTKMMKLEVENLTGKIEVLASVSFKYIEDACKEEWLKYNDSLPPWNFQERGEVWDEGILYFKANRDEYREKIRQIEASR